MDPWDRKDPHPPSPVHRLLSKALLHCATFGAMGPKGIIIQDYENHICLRTITFKIGG